MIRAMPAPDAAALSALLSPSTLLRKGPLARHAPWTHAQVKAVSRGARADLALVAGSGPALASAIQQAASRARVVLCLTSAAEPMLQDEAPATLLGPGSGLWSPRIRAGIHGPGYRSRGAISRLALVQDPRVGELLLQAAREDLLPLSGVVATARDQPTSWCDLAQAAGCMTPAPPLLVALHRQLSASSLARLAEYPAPVVLLLTGAARGPLAWPDYPGSQPPTGEAMCRGLGLPLVPTPTALVAASRLQSRARPPASPRVIIQARGAGEEALLRDAWAKAGPPAGARLTITDRDTAAGKPGEPPHLVISNQDEACSPTTLDAFCALSRAAEAAPPLGRRPRVSTGHAMELLDGWPALLDEPRAKELAACYGLDAPAEGMASSASAAQRVAQQVGYPVAVKPVGPGLRQRQRLGALALDLGTSASVRQAFSDVLLPVTGQEPPVLLEGVLVSAMVPLPGALDCTLLWPEAGPPLILFQVRRPGGHRGDLRVEGCPLHPDHARRVAGWLAEQGFWGAAGPGRSEMRYRMATTLERLSWMGPDLASRMRWLRLDTVSPPVDAFPSVLIDGYGEQGRGPG